MRHTTDFDIEAIGSVLQPPSDGVPREPIGVRSCYTRCLRRPLDFIAVLMAAPIVLPVVIILATIILWQGEKPFYTQPRVGRSGRSFRLWKLRAVVENAEARLAEHLATNQIGRAHV